MQPSHSYFFHHIWLLLLQYLIFLFLTEKRQASASRDPFCRPAFPLPSSMQCSALVPQLAPKVEGPIKSRRFRSHSLLAGAKPTLQPPGKGTWGDYPHRVGVDPELLLKTASAERVREVSDTLIRENCFLLFYPRGDLLMLKIGFGRWSLPCCW